MSDYVDIASTGAHEVQKEPTPPAEGDTRGDIAIEDNGNDSEPLRTSTTVVKPSADTSVSETLEPPEPRSPEEKLDLPAIKNEDSNSVVHSNIDSTSTINTNASSNGNLENRNSTTITTLPTHNPIDTSFGIAYDTDGSNSDVDEHGRHRKGKKKERSHSKIKLQHKKNLIGETIYKGHQSWVLMLNIQTGIRNAVGKGVSQSRTTLQSPRSLLAQSHSQPQPPPPPQAAQLRQAHSEPESPTSGPPSTKYKYANGILGPDQFEILEEFYASPRVLQFPSAGSSQTIPHQTGPFKFKDYCPHAFRFLRHRFGIDPAEYMVSLCNTQKNGENALRELPTPGKSGSLFFFSHDMRFILKTIPKSEAKLLRLLLPSYVAHIADDENTLLPKFFGLHRVKPHRGRQVRFVVMGNVFQTKKKIHERYDLKGSTLGRQASEEEKQKDTVTYKDLDFRERHVRLHLGAEKRSALLEQLQRDCKFLALLNIMDYSLLIGIHYSEREEGDRSPPPSPQMSLPTSDSKNWKGGRVGHDVFHSIFQSNDGGMRGVDENGAPVGKYYYMGIIDILMLYSIRKKLEHTYKTLRYKKSTSRKQKPTQATNNVISTTPTGGEEISSISPPEYAARFYEFVATSIV